MSDQHPQICDYEGSNYRTEFWEGRGRDYEDQVERQVLQRLLPTKGHRLLEIGAGFGRLTQEYNAYEQVVLLDYSFSQLQYAREQLGQDGRYVYVAADAYKLPFQPGVFDGATMIRVIHHMANAPAALQQVRRVLVPGGIFILEFANKRNLKALLRYALRQQTWNPNNEEPVEFVELNFDFHPAYIARELENAHFQTEARIPVSFLRLGALKRRLPTSLLVAIDQMLQTTGLLVSPSVFTQSTAVQNTISQIHGAIFACPECRGHLTHRGDTMVCEVDNLRWAIRDGIYDFKAPVET